MTDLPEAFLAPSEAANLGSIRNEELLQILAVHTAIHLALFDLDVKFLYLNKAALHLISYPRDLSEQEIIGRHWSVIGIPDIHMQPIEEAIRHVIQTGQTFSGQHAYKPTVPPLINPELNEPEFVLDQDNQRIFKFHITPVYNQQQEIYRVAVTAEDITKLEIAKSTAIAHQISEQRMRAITDALPVLIAHVDQDMRYTYNSPYYAQLLQRPLTEITGQFIWDVIGEDAFAEVKSYATAALRGEKQNYQVTIKAPDGGNRYFQTVMIPQTQEEQVTGYYAITFDVTDLAEAQEKTLTQERYLAHMNRLTTVNEMTSNIAHELNQPLTAINNYASVLHRFFDQLFDHIPVQPDGEPDLEELQQDIKQALTSINQQTNRAGKIIKDVREFVRQYGEGSTSLDLNQLVDDVLIFVRSTLVAHQTTVKFDRQDQPLYVNGEATQLQQVLINFILNAVDAMEPVREAADRLINISIQPNSSADHTSYDVLVKDNGAPVSKSDIQNIFAPFYTTKADGMGMGLAICASIAEAHGGKLSAKPNESDGLTMILTLPAASEYNE